MSWNNWLISIRSLWMLFICQKEQWLHDSGMTCAHTEVTKNFSRTNITKTIKHHKRRHEISKEINSHCNSTLSDNCFHFLRHVVRCGVWQLRALFMIICPKTHFNACKGNVQISLYPLQPADYTAFYTAEETTTLRANNSIWRRWGGLCSPKALFKLQHRLKVLDALLVVSA